MTSIPAGWARVRAILPPATAQDGRGPGLDVVLETSEGEHVVRLTGVVIRERNWMVALQTNVLVEWGAPSAGQLPTIGMTGGLSKAEPIELARKDGTDYLLFHPVLRCWIVGFYDEGNDLPGWYSDTERTYGDAELGYLPDPERFEPRWFCELPPPPLDA